MAAEMSRKKQQQSKGRQVKVQGTTGLHVKKIPKQNFVLIPSGTPLMFSLL